MTTTILLIDDCADFRSIAKAFLESEGHEVIAAACPHDAFQVLPEYVFDLILCDLHMPFITGERQNEFQTSFNVGILTVRELQDLFPNIPVIGITSTPAAEMHKVRRVLEGIAAVPKPCSKRELIALVEFHLHPKPMFNSTKDTNAPLHS